MCLAPQASRRNPHCPSTPPCCLQVFVAGRFDCPSRFEAECVLDGGQRPVPVDPTACESPGWGVLLVCECRWLAGATVDLSALPPARPQCTPACLEPSMGPPQRRAPLLHRPGSATCCGWRATRRGCGGRWLCCAAQRGAAGPAITEQSSALLPCALRLRWQPPRWLHLAAFLAFMPLPPVSCLWSASGTVKPHYSAFSHSCAH